MAEDIHFITWGKNAGYVYCVFKIKDRYWEYPVQFEDSAKKIARIARSWKTRKGKIIPPATGDALNEAKRLANGKETDVTDREMNFGKPAEERQSVWPKPVSNREQNKIDRYNACPSCGKTVEDDYCQYCGWQRVSSWFSRFQRHSASH